MIFASGWVWLHSAWGVAPRACVLRCGFAPRRPFRDLDGGRVDTLHREETFYAKAVARLEKSIKGLDCRRTFFLSYDLAARHPHAHAVAFAQFLGVAKVGFFRSGENATVDCLTRVKPWLARFL